MRKNRMRLTESQLHRVIKESVKSVLNESIMDGEDNDMDYKENFIKPSNIMYDYLEKMAKHGAPRDRGKYEIALKHLDFLIALIAGNI